MLNLFFECKMRLWGTPLVKTARGANAATNAIANRSPPVRNLLLVVPISVVSIQNELFLLSRQIHGGSAQLQYSRGPPPPINGLKRHLSDRLVTKTLFELTQQGLVIRGGGSARLQDVCKPHQCTR